jgi:hypothetical protein
MKNKPERAKKGYAEKPDQQEERERHFDEDDVLPHVQRERLIENMMERRGPGER